MKPLAMRFPRIEEFLHSTYFIVMCSLISFFGFFFHVENIAMAVLIALLGFVFVFSRDLTPSYLIFFLVCWTPLWKYGEGFDYFLPIFYSLIPTAPAIIFHFVNYPPNRVRGRFFVSLLFVAVACTIGGLTATSAKEYFALPAIYYIFMLGFGMVLFYLIAVNYTSFDKRSIFFIVRAFVVPACLSMLIYLLNYLLEIPNYAEGKEFRLLYFQFKNNFGNYLLLGIPLTFYLSVKRSGIRSVFYYVLGLMEIATIVISQSRGATMAIAVIAPITLIAMPFMASKKKDKIKFAIWVSLTVIALLAIVFAVRHELKEFLDKISIKEDESREFLYKLAFENFKKHPIFGVGLQYTNPDFEHYQPQKMAMFWYHSTPMQILGSLGLVGVFAYTAQFFDRLAVLFKNSKFNFFVALSFAGFEAYQIVNPGDFTPVPFVFMLMMLLSLADRHNYNVRSGIEKDASDTIIKKLSYDILPRDKIIARLKANKFFAIFFDNNSKPNVYATSDEIDIMKDAIVEEEITDSTSISYLLYGDDEHVDQEDPIVSDSDKSGSDG